MQTECGCTRISLLNAKELIQKHGRPKELIFFADPERCEYRIFTFFVDCEFTFTGFSWGYQGEGPRGLQEFLKMMERPKLLIAEDIFGRCMFNDQGLTYVELKVD